MTATARSLAVALFGFLVGLILTAMLVPIAAHAQTSVPTPAPGKTVSIIVYGDDPCPAATGDEIVVCARQPESERFRIPKRFRGRKTASSPAGNAWSNKVGATDNAGRAAAGLPNTCSAVGTGGQSGCFLQFQQQAGQAKAQAPKDSDIP